MLHRLQHPLKPYRLQSLKSLMKNSPSMIQRKKTHLKTIFTKNFLQPKQSVNHPLITTSIIVGTRLRLQRQ